MEGIKLNEIFKENINGQRQTNKLFCSKVVKNKTFFKMQHKNLDRAII